MKKLILFLPILLIACSAEDETPTIEVDIKTLTSFQTPFIEFGATKEEMEVFEKGSLYSVGTILKYKSNVPGVMETQYIFESNGLKETRVIFYEGNSDFMLKWLKEKYGEHREFPGIVSGKWYYYDSEDAYIKYQFDTEFNQSVIIYSSEPYSEWTENR